MKVLALFVCCLLIEIFPSLVRVLVILLRNIQSPKALNKGVLTFPRRALVLLETA